MCCRDRYALVSDFRWLVKVLVSLAMLPGTGVGVGSSDSSNNSSGSGNGSSLGGEIAEALMDVALRVEAVRPALVRSMLRLLLASRQGESVADGGSTTSSSPTGEGDSSGCAEEVSVVLCCVLLMCVSLS